VPSIRLVRACSCVIAAAGLVAALMGCSSSGTTSPSQPDADDVWVRATITLLDDLPPCNPPIICAPEFFDCAGTTPITVPRTWVMEATSATAGMETYTSPASAPGVTDTTGQIAIAATDLVHETAVALQFNINLAPDGSVEAANIVGFNDNFANVDVRCTEINSATEPVTLFGLTVPGSVTITSLDVAGVEIDFAQQRASGFSPAGIIEGRFSFDGTNFQEVSQIYSGLVHVEGCFRLNLPRREQNIPVIAPPAACP